MRPRVVDMKPANVGFISFRLAGLDGVSLETRKWAEVFEEEGFNCFFLAGELDYPPEQSFLVKEAHFRHPEVREVYDQCFDFTTREPATTRKIQKLTRRIKDQLYEFIRQYRISLLVPQNVLAIPLNIPLALALTELISETGIPTIAHHHDFFWERQRFLTNAVWDYLNMAFPPHLPSISHVVINSSADNQLSLRTGISGTIIPNVMDFETPAPPIDDYSSDVRQALGVADDELLVLQPTRVVKRKGIEHAIELVKRLNMKAKLVISHASGDEGYDYEMRVREYAEFMGVETLFITDIINEKRGLMPDGRKVYSLEDIYPHADLVTYISVFEGFGNAFLEAVYFKKPIVVNEYSIYQFDIKPKGFRAIELQGYVTVDSLLQLRALLRSPEQLREMVEHNYELARRYYSYSTLKHKLRGLICDKIGSYNC